MAESLMESVNDGYASLTEELKGLSKVEKVLLDTADSVIDTKKKIEFGVKQIMYKIGELVKLSGGKLESCITRCRALSKFWRRSSPRQRATSTGLATIWERWKVRWRDCLTGW